MGLELQGLLADVNVQGHLSHLARRLDSLGLLAILESLGLRLATFADLPIAPDLDDRSLWNRCQSGGWVLFTENRNQDGTDSLQSTLADSWRAGHLPILTLANKRKFEADRRYADRVATDVAEILFGIVQGEFLDQSRIFVPRR